MHIYGIGPLRQEGAIPYERSSVILALTLINLCSILLALIRLRSILCSILSHSLRTILLFLIPVHSIVVIMQREQATKLAPSSAWQGQRKQSGVVQPTSNEIRVASNTQQKRKRREQMLDLPGKKNIRVQPDSEVSMNSRQDSCWFSQWELTVRQRSQEMKKSRRLRWGRKMKGH